jgi:CYTH domain-containing protein
MGDGLSRTEIEIALSRAQFDQLWPYTDGRRVDKTRYAVAVGPHMAELDIFSGDLKGLRLVEVEFTSVASSQRFVAPVWFGREVTADQRYKNKALAVHGSPGRRRRPRQQF